MYGRPKRFPFFIVLIFIFGIGLGMIHALRKCRLAVVHWNVFQNGILELIASRYFMLKWLV